MARTPTDNLESKKTGGGMATATAKKSSRRQSRKTGKASSLLPFSDLQELVDLLESDPRYVFRPLRGFHDPCSEDRIAISLRIDISGDPANGLRLCRYLTQRGLEGTTFLSLEEPYYGKTTKTGMRHAAGLGDLVLALLVTGQEVGFKINPFHSSIRRHRNVAELIVQEIAWLRSQDLSIKGIASDPPIHDVPAEAMELFTGMAVSGRTDVDIGNEVLPLQTIDMNSLGVEYEASFRKPRQEPVAEASMRVYFDTLCGQDLDSPTVLRTFWQQNAVFDREVDFFNAKLLPDQRWALLPNFDDSAIQYRSSTRDLVGSLGSLSGGFRVIIVVDSSYLSAD